MESDGDGDEEEDGVGGAGAGGGGGGALADRGDGDDFIPLRLTAGGGGLSGGGNGELHGARGAPAAVPAALRRLATTAPSVALATGPEAAALAAAAGLPPPPSPADADGWAREQLRRGGAAGGASTSGWQDAGKLRPGLTVDDASWQQGGGGGPGGGRAPPANGALGLPVASSVPVDADAVVDAALAALSRDAATTRQAAGAAERDAARTAAELAALRASMPALRTRLTTASASFDTYAGLRAYLTDWVACLREKAGLVDEWHAAEAAFVAGRARRRATAARALVAADVARATSRDGCTLVLAGGWAPLPPGAGGVAQGAGDAVVLAPAAADALSRAAAALASGSELVVDAACDYASAAAAAAPAPSGGSPTASRDEGDAEDDAAAAGRLRSAAALLLADVQDDFSLAGSALARFASWRSHPQLAVARTYADAYAYASLGDLLALVVRAQLAGGWHPLAAPPGGGGGSAGAAAEADPSLDARFEWFRAAWEYGEGTQASLGRLQPAGGGGGGGGGGPDAGVAEAAASDESLLPRLAVSGAVPRLAVLLRHAGGAWDPACPASTARCVAAVKEVLLYDPAPDALASVLGAVAGALQEAVGDACVPVLVAARRAVPAPAPPAPSPASPPDALACATGLNPATLRCFLHAVALLRGVAAWGFALAPALVARLAVGGVVGKALLPACLWAVGAASPTANGSQGGGAPLHLAGGMVAAVVGALPAELRARVLGGGAGGGGGGVGVGGGGGGDGGSQVEVDAALRGLQGMRDAVLGLAAAQAQQLGGAGGAPAWMALLRG
jgi:hypothetical protein